VNAERRQYQRLNLIRPIDGWFGDWPVRLLDVSVKGALVESEEELPDDARALLRFWWRGEELEVLAHTARRDDSRTGLSFVDESDDLRRLIAESAAELLRAQEANALGDRAANIVDHEATLTAASFSLLTGFVSWIFRDGKWKRRPAIVPDQPEDGFTISAGEPEDQVELLRATYESGDTEARRMTRLFAELSVNASKQQDR
jgi:hypothetical protein